MFLNANGGSGLRGSLDDLIDSVNNGACIRNVITRLGLATTLDNVQVC